MHAKRMIFLCMALALVVLASRPSIDDEEEDEYTIIRHDDIFAKSYFEDVRDRKNSTTGFISSSISVFHFDYMMNAYRSMTVTRRQYFERQIAFETNNFTGIANQSADRLILGRKAFVSYQAKRYAVPTYLTIIKSSCKVECQQFDIINQQGGYAHFANEFVNQFGWSPQKIPKDNCTIGLVSTVGVDAKWKYPFQDAGKFMKAEGKFNFAHDLVNKIDILQIPFIGGEMLLTIVISRLEVSYEKAMQLFQLAFLGRFRVQIKTVYLPKIAYSTIIKDYSKDREKGTKPYNIYRCMTQKLVLNFNESGIGTHIPSKAQSNNWNYDKNWKYDSNYYPPADECTVDSPFFFTIHFVPTQDVVFMGRWSPSCGSYMEQLLYTNGDDYYA